MKVNRQLGWILLVVAGFLIVLQIANVVGASVLEREVEGTICRQIDAPPGVSCRSARLLREPTFNRTLLATPTSGAKFSCVRIDQSFRCEVPGPTFLQVTFPDRRVWFELYDARRAILFGNNDEVSCTLVQLEASS